MDFIVRYMGVIRLSIGQMTFLENEIAQMAPREQSSTLVETQKQWVDVYIDATNIVPFWNELGMSQSQLEHANLRGAYPYVGRQVVYYKENCHRIEAAKYHNPSMNCIVQLNSIHRGFLRSTPITYALTDTLYISIATNILRALIDPVDIGIRAPDKIRTLRTMLLGYWTETPPYVEISEGEFQPIEGNPSFDLAYNQLFLAAIRQFPYLCQVSPKLENGQKPAMSPRSCCLSLFYRRAQLLGFHNSKITAGGSITSRSFRPKSFEGAELSDPSWFGGEVLRRFSGPIQSHRSEVQTIQNCAFLPTITGMIAQSELTVPAFLQYLLHKFFDPFEITFDLTRPRVYLNGNPEIISFSFGDVDNWTMAKESFPFPSVIDGGQGVTSYTLPESDDGNAPLHSDGTSTILTTPCSESPLESVHLGQLNTIPYQDTKTKVKSNDVAGLTVTTPQCFLCNFEKNDNFKSEKRGLLSLPDHDSTNTSFGREQEHKEASNNGGISSGSEVNEDLDRATPYLPFTFLTTLTLTAQAGQHESETGRRSRSTSSVELAEQNHILAGDLDEAPSSHRNTGKPSIRIDLWRQFQPHRSASQNVLASGDSDGSGDCYSKRRITDDLPAMSSSDKDHADKRAEDNTDERFSRARKRQKVVHNSADNTAISRQKAAEITIQVSHSVHNDHSPVTIVSFRTPLPTLT